MTNDSLRLAIVSSDRKRARALANPNGITTDLYDLRLRSFARTPYEHLFTELATLDSAEAALVAGCDAIFIDTFADYAIERIRAISSLPVIGAGEAGIAEAAKEGRRFSIVTVWPESMSYLYDERLANCSGGAACGGVHYFSRETELEKVGKTEGVMERMIRVESDLVTQLAEACRRAVEVDGTEAVLLGCTCMSPIAGRIQELCSFPVLDASKEGQQAAFDALLAGTSAPTRVASADFGLASKLVDAWIHGSAPAEIAPDECEVCAIAQSQL